MPYQSQVPRASSVTSKSPTPPTLTPPPSQAMATPLDESSQPSVTSTVPQSGTSTKKYSRANILKFVESSALPPRLSTWEEFSLNEEELPGAQVMRQRLQAQLAKPKPKLESSEKSGLASLLPEDTITKLKNTPGELQLKSSR